MIEATPQNLIGERAYISDALDQKLKKEGAKWIAFHRCNRKMKMQEG